MSRGTTESARALRSSSQWKILFEENERTRADFPRVLRVWCDDTFSGGRDDVNVFQLRVTLGNIGENQAANPLTTDSFFFNEDVPAFGGIALNLPSGRIKVEVRILDVGPPIGGTDPQLHAQIDPGQAVQRFVPGRSLYVSPSSISLFPMPGTTQLIIGSSAAGGTVQVGPIPTIVPIPVNDTITLPFDGRITIGTGPGPASVWWWYQLFW